MSLSPEATRERFWGPYPALRKVLEEKRIPAHYYGWSSVSDNMFDQFQRLLEISVLLREFHEDVVRTATMNTKVEPPILKDLERIKHYLSATSKYFSEQSDQVGRMCDEVHRKMWDKKEPNKAL